MLRVAAAVIVKYADTFPLYNIAKLLIIIKLL